MALIQGVQPSTAASGGPARVAPGRSSRVSERTVLLVASFGALLAFLDVTIVNVAFPSIQASFADASIESISWVLNAYNIVFAAFLIVFGRLGDLVGRRRLYLAGIGLFTLASLVSAMSTSVMLLVVARVVQALGAAMLVPASLAVVIEGFPKEKRSRAVGLWGAAAAVAAGLGPPVGGALVEAGAGAGPFGSTCLSAWSPCGWPGGSSSRAAPLVDVGFRTWSGPCFSLVRSASPRLPSSGAPSGAPRTACSGSRSSGHSYCSPASA